MYQIVFLDCRSMTVIERTRMRGSYENVRAWALGYSRFLGEGASFALSECETP